ncbi:MAG: amidase, partial [Bifidobacteriaceae bacterium]|nr:amidase [Bifidobacteriaceae bacterium]
MRRADALERPDWCDLARCATDLGRGALTSLQLVAQGVERVAALDRDAEDGPGLGAMICLNPSAMAEAAASDARRAAGRPASPLDGVTFVVKDCVETAGLPTTHGSALFADFRPDRDAPAVARLRAAGLVLLGKASLDDFAAACFGESSLRGVMRNPYDLDRMVGGSSGGSAVAVAAGYVPLAVGTDTGGSLRIPAALTGVATWRPSLGLIPFLGAFPSSPSQDVIGPIALDVAGLAAVAPLMADAAPPAALGGSPARPPGRR